MLTSIVEEGLGEIAKSPSLRSTQSWAGGGPEQPACSNWLWFEQNDRPDGLLEVPSNLHYSMFL